jgi:hypothetical protein
MAIACGFRAAVLCLPSLDVSGVVELLGFLIQVRQQDLTSSRS